MSNLFKRFIAVSALALAVVLRVLMVEDVVAIVLVLVPALLGGQEV